MHFQSPPDRTRRSTADPAFSFGGGRALLMRFIDHTHTYNENANVNVEFKVTLHEQVRYGGTLQY